MYYLFGNRMTTCDGHHRIPTVTENLEKSWNFTISFSKLGSVMDLETFEKLLEYCV